MSVVKLKNPEHVNNIKQALENEMRDDVNIRFFCEDGQFVTKATPFKHYSNYFFKLFRDLGHYGSLHGCEYSVYLPNVSKDTVTHITNMISNGCSYFHTQKVLILK